MVVWQLETDSQQAAIEDLNRIVGFALQGHRKSQNYLRKLWDNEKWPSIKKKLVVEGSAWYVWWMDGVNAHLCHLIKDIKVVSVETKI